VTGEQSAAEEFRRRVEAAAEGTPYVVTATDRGFDVALDIVDARWFGILNKAGLSKVYTHHVAVRGDGSYTVTDDVRTVEWVSGVPRVTASAERIHGRVKEFGVQTVWAVDENGRFGQVVDFRFSSEEGRDLITGVAAQLDLRQRRGAAETTGLVFGVVCGVGSVVGLVVVLVLFLMGKF
jgi:hypothetical protein